MTFGKRTLFPAVVCTAAAVAVAAAAATTGNARQPSARSIKYNVTLRAQRFVDLPPKGNSIGDLALLRAAYTDSSRRPAGSDSETCITVSTRPLLLSCSISASVHGGQLVAEGTLNPMRLPWTIPLVGGTGTFDGAHGTLTSSPGTSRRTETFTFKLIS